MSNAQTIRDWIRGRLVPDVPLAAAAPGGVWYKQAPAGTARPFVVYDEFSPLQYGATQTLDGTQTLGNGLIQVLTWMQGTDRAAIEAARVRVKARLHKAQSTLVDGRIIKAIEIAEIDPPPVQDGNVIYSAGGSEFRVWIEAGDV